MVTVESSYDDILAYVKSHSLDDLVHDNAFISALFMNQSSRETDAFHHLYDLITHYFHNYFTLTSRQRKHVTTMLMAHEKNLGQIFGIYKKGPGPPGEAKPVGGPPSVMAQQALAGGATGPYPVGGGGGHAAHP